jgi:transposase
MTGKIKRTFTSEFKLEAAQLVVDQNDSIRIADSAMNVGKSTLDKWVRQLKNELQGTLNYPTALTADHLKIKELEKTIKRIEMEKETLKNRLRVHTSHRIEARVQLH